MLGALLVVIYLGRLLVLDPPTGTGKIAILAPAALTGLILNPDLADLDRRDALGRQACVSADTRRGKGTP